MDQAKINKRLKNLQKVKAIVEIAKIDTIKKIAKSNNIKTHHYEIAEISQQIINYSRSLNRWSNKITNKSQTKKTLWIFITLPSRLIKTSYIKYETILEKNVNPTNDAIIAIGDPAINFVNKKNYKLLTKFEDLEGTNLKLSSIIMHAINSRKFTNISIVSQAVKAQDNFYDIYPFEEIKYNHHEMKTKKFFYSLSNTMDQISYNYIKNIISGMYQEAYRNFHTEKLVRHETSLKSIDQRIYDLKMSLIKNYRKKETEEIIQVIQLVKRR